MDRHGEDEEVRPVACGGRLLLLLLLVTAAVVPCAQAQDAPPLQQEPAVVVQGPDEPVSEGRPPLVTRVRFEGNTVFPDRELARHVRTEANRRFLGIPGLTWWRWVYQLGDALGGRLGQALMNGGEAPALLDQTLLREDAERLAQFYRQEGFREARVEVEAVPLGLEVEAVSVVFHVDPGKPLYARTVTYEGLEQLEEPSKRQLAEASVLEPAAVSDSLPLQFRVVPRRYSEPELVQERQRILRFLQQAGYAAVTRDSVRALVYPRLNQTEAPDSFDVTFRIQPGPRYRMGAVHFDVQGPEDGVRPRTDTVAGGPEPVTASIRGETRLRGRLLDRALQLRPGAWYDADALQATKRRLEGTGVFAFTDINALPDSTYPDSAGVLYLPHRLDLRTRNRHQVRFETFLLQRSDILGSTGSELGTGVATSYENVNLLGGGETFELRVAGSVASSFDAERQSRSLLSSAQAEANTSITYPYLVGAFDGLEDRFDLYDARTRLSVSLLTARRENLRFIIRGRGAARFRLEMLHTATVSSLVDLIDVSVSSPDTLRGFQDFLDRIIGPDDAPIVTDPVQRAQIREDYTEPQVNSAVRYTFRSANVNPLRRAQGYSYEASFEVGNTIPVLLDRLVLTRDTVESSLPGLPLLRGDSESRLVYRPYVRLLGDFRRYWPVGEDDVVALKFIGGWAQPTGKPDVVPFDRRFYSGGASSVRGWELRELRPQPLGAVAGSTTNGDVPNLLGGDVKLEASGELRSTVFRNVLTADWVSVFFLDAGNVWFGPRNPGEREGRFRLGTFYNQLGVGSGLGLRLAWDYLILRLDAAVKVHDPLRPGTGLFPDGLGAPRLHFGIGHAF